MFPHSAEDVLSHSWEYILMFISIGAALLGIGFGFLLYLLKEDLPERLSEKFSRAYKVAYNKYYKEHELGLNATEKEI